LRLWSVSSVSVAVFILLGSAPSPGRAAALGLFPGPRALDAGLFAVADLNGDGVLDLAAADRGGASVALGNGDGSFQAPDLVVVNDGPNEVAVADLDGDAIADLVTVNINSDNVSVLLGNGDGSFQAAVSFAAGIAPRSIALADFDAGAENAEARTETVASRVSRVAATRGDRLSGVGDLGLGEAEAEAEAEAGLS